MAFATLLAWACNSHAPRPSSAVAPAVLLVSLAQASANGPADGSAARPFRTLQDAVRAAPSGALVALDAGEFEGGVTLRLPIVLMGRGSARTRIVARKDAPDAPTLSVRGTDHVELRGLAVEGGRIGVAVEGGAGHLLNDVSLRGQAETGLQARGAEVTLRGSEVIDVAAGLAGRGLDVASGSLFLRGCALRRAGRRAIVVSRGRALLEDVDAAGSSLSSLQATDGAEVRVRGGSFSDNGGAALYAGGARLAVERARIEGNEYGVLGFRGARVAVTSSTFLDQRVAAIAFVDSSGSVRASTIARGGVEGGIFALNTTARLIIEDTLISDPGAFGVHLVHSTAELRGNDVARAVQDRQSDLGDGLYAIDSTVSIEGNIFRGNQGNGVVLTRSKATLRSSDLSGNGRAGLALLDNATATATAMLFGENRQGVSIGERSALSVEASAFQANERFAIDAACGEAVMVREGGARNLYLGPSPRRRACP